VHDQYREREDVMFEDRVMGWETVRKIDSRAGVSLGD